MRRSRPLRPSRMSRRAEAAVARFVKFVGVHAEVAVNPERVLYVAPLPETGDCWLYFGGKGAGSEEGAPPVIVVQVKGSLDEVVAALEAAGAPSEAEKPSDSAAAPRSVDDTPQPDPDTPLALPPPDHKAPQA